MALQLASDSVSARTLGEERQVAAVAFALSSLPWFDLGIAAALAAAGALVWGIAEYGDAPQTGRAELIAQTRLDIVIGLFVGPMAYALTAWYTGDAKANPWHAFVACGTAGVGARPFLRRIRRFASFLLSLRDPKR